MGASPRLPPSRARLVPGLLPPACALCLLAGGASRGADGGLGSTSPKKPFCFTSRLSLLPAGGRGVPPSLLPPGGRLPACALAASLPAEGTGEGRAVGPTPGPPGPAALAASNALGCSGAGPAWAAAPPHGAGCSRTAGRGTSAPSVSSSSCTAISRPSSPCTTLRCISARSVAANCGGGEGWPASSLRRVSARERCGQRVDASSAQNAPRRLAAAAPGA
mmetsp:Transcript_41606/g.106471  ORF Transcript_41606/g.106471 Transcript_41606/m.106471 type:complete len:220 (+) Transcript_41606:504-1163(+)